MEDYQKLLNKYEKELETLTEQYNIHDKEFKYGLNVLENKILKSQYSFFSKK